MGQINLALLLASGAVGEKDLVGAYKWMKLAAQTGNQGAEKFSPLSVKNVTRKNWLKRNC